MKLSGALNLRKAAGPTSHDLVDEVRRLVPPRTKVGHAGTLDPMAEGVLPVCLGAATKLFPYLLDCRKTYRAVMRFGLVTDTQDATGRALAEREPGEITLEDAQRLLDTFMGESVQVPPMYSALKQSGTRLHVLARAGVEVERKGRPIQVFGVRALAAAGPLLTFEVTCSRGTYIRALCHDVGALRGSGGCLEALTRTALGPFLLDASRSLEEIRALAGEGRLACALVSPAEALAHLPALTVRPEAGGRVRHGGALRPGDWGEGETPPGEGPVRLLSPEGELLAVGRVLSPREQGRGWVAPERVFA
ncbi:MAG: tRNA pseudouridine(55) synthase TruB [Candidatus Tectomicrobia bacterium]|nr:tRNA pseudouridine(55) synthase TruB [Candidatus Tectomicrobia bacterium]